MQELHKNRVLRTLVITWMLICLVGCILGMIIDSDWRYPILDISSIGFTLAVYFTFCAFANILGTRFKTKRAFPRTLPFWMIAITGIVATICTIAGMAMIILGNSGIAGLWVMLVPGGILIISIPAAFFIRGMESPTAAR